MIRRFRISTVAWWIFVFGVTGASVIAAEEKSPRPNVIMILADDLGYGDVQCLNPGRGKIATPQLDQLARQGMIFSDAHSSSAVCTPSRYNLMTGRYNWRSKLQSGVGGGLSPSLIPESRLTVAGFMRDQGYRTGMIGKWHLGMKMPEDLLNGELRETPADRGFEYFFGISASLDHPPYAFIENHRFTEAPSVRKALLRGREGPAAPGFEAEKVLPELTRRSVEWIQAHQAEPFFLYVALNSPHTPLNPSKEWLGKSGLGSYADFVMQTDAAIGEIVGAVDRCGIGTRTMVIVSSDNGCAPYIGTSNQVDPERLEKGGVKSLEDRGHFPSGDRRGYKSDIWDGGHHVPYLVRWPQVVKAGSQCDQMICLGDLMATCAEMVDKPLPETAGEDSVSFLSLLRGKNQPTRSFLVEHSINGKFAIRDERWKLILAPGSGGWSAPGDAKATKDGMPVVQLYDLRADIGEIRNLADAHPEVVSRLKAELQRQVEQGRSTPGIKRSNDVAVDFEKKGGPKQKK